MGGRHSCLSFQKHLPTNNPILDYASISTPQWLTLTRRWLWTILKITVGLFAGAALGWAVSPQRVYRTAAIFYADPPPFVGHDVHVPGWYEVYLRQQHDLHDLTCTTLRSPDLLDIATQQRGPHPASIFKTAAQLHDHLEISEVPETTLLQVAVTDVSQSGADQTLEAFVVAANQRIGLTSSLKHIGIGNFRARTPDHRQQIFVTLGAAIGALAMIGFLLLLNRRSNATAPLPPLQPEPSS